MSTYPARCVAKLERRSVPGEDGASVLGEIEELIGTEKATARITLERPSSEVAPDHPLSAAVERIAGHPPLIGVAYWMDMALMNAAGVPTVAFGPSGEGEHADVEWVDIASVQRCVSVYVMAAEQLCN
jgi:acetylornithine deacetylase